MRSGTLWRKDVVVNSEQSLPTSIRPRSPWPMAPARLPGSLVMLLLFRLEGTPEPSPLSAPKPRLGALVLALIAAASRCGWARSIR